MIGIGMKILMIHPHDLFDRAEPWTIRILSIAREFTRMGHSVKLCYFPLSLTVCSVSKHWTRRGEK